MNDMIVRLGSVVKSGAVIPVLVMLPNLVWMFVPGSSVGTPGDAPQIAALVENAGRAVTLALPFFYSLDLTKRYAIPAMVGIGLALAVYYAAWFRYFAGGMAEHFFSLSLLGIPAPMIAMPIIVFILAAYLMDSWLMFAASLLFGAAHIWVSAANY